MRTQIYKISITGWLVFLTIVLQSQTHSVRFKRLTVDDGMTQNSVTTIFQDHYGFMWFGTQDGVNRYDGYAFDNWRSLQQGKQSICNNYIWDIHEDAKGIIWIATFQGGLIRMDQAKNNITCFNTQHGNLQSDRIFSITEAPDNMLWLGSNEGLIAFNPENFTSQFYLNSQQADGSNALNFIGKTVLDTAGILWIKSDSGLLVFNTIEKQLIDVSVLFNTLKSPLQVRDIVLYNNAIAIAFDSGLYVIDLKNKSMAELLSFKNRPEQVRNILPLQNGNWFIGTDKGIIYWKMPNNTFEHFESDASNINSLSENSILSMYQSQDGVIWIGTRNGLSYIENFDTKIQLVNSNMGNTGLIGPNVNCFVRDNDSLLWIGTSKGLDLLNLNNSTFRHFTPGMRGAQSITSSYILCLYKDEEGINWIGTKGGGLYFIKPGSFQIERLAIPGLETVSIHSILKDKETLWLGTAAQGLWKYQMSNNIVTKYQAAEDDKGLSHSFVFCLLKDMQQRIWIGTPTGGLNVMDPVSETFLHLQHNTNIAGSLSNDIILSLYADAEHILWIGTSNGLNKLNIALDKISWTDLQGITKPFFTTYSRENDLPNEVVYGILEDNANYLWLSTNRGLAQFDKQSGRAIFTLDVSDGLQNNEFNQNAFYKDNFGTMYFGGIEGFNYFHPDSLIQDAYKAPIVFTSFALYNEPLLPGTETMYNYLLPSAIFTKPEIQLSYKHDVISIGFSALQFINPSKNEYRYMLEGFDKKWILSGTTHNVTYTNLDPGNYIFKVETKNNNGSWSAEGAALNIHISSPPWATWYAYVFYFLITVLLLYLFVQYRIRKATKQVILQQAFEKIRVEEREMFRKKSAADFHDEAGKYITKITLFSELARLEEQPETPTKILLEKIQINAAGLSSSMRDFLWAMDANMDNLEELINRLQESGNSILTETGIIFRLEGKKPEYKNCILPLSVRRSILQIFQEAMLNCIKHASAKEVVLSVSLENNMLTILLKDNGKGFNAEIEKKGHYGIGLMKERAKKSGLELQIQSEKNSGTEIQIIYKILQMGNSHV